MELVTEYNPDKGLYGEPEPAVIDKVGNDVNFVMLREDGTIISNFDFSGRDDGFAPTFDELVADFNRQFDDVFDYHAGLVIETEYSVLEPLYGHLLLT